MIRPRRSAQPKSGRRRSLSRFLVPGDISGELDIFANSGFSPPPYPPVLGPAEVVEQRHPGGYPFVPNVGIRNDDMSSLRPL